MAEPHSMNSKTNQSKETVFLSEEEVEQLKQCLPKVHPPTQSPLVSNSPHVLVCGLETAVYGNSLTAPSPHQLKELPSPRLLQSHVPYASLLESMKTSP
uniref:Sulfotransferase n=1 Tax=Chenopodium quinoa TaxID=63459 RepID=A0A803LKL4_CHEQI